MYFSEAPINLFLSFGRVLLVLVLLWWKAQDLLRARQVYT